MKLVSTNRIRALLDYQVDFHDFAGRNFREELHAAVSDEHSRRPFDASNLVDWHETLFRLDLRMNRYADVWDSQFIRRMQKEIFKRFGGQYHPSGLDKHQFRGAILQALRQHMRSPATFAIDCHVHTREGSKCAISDAGEIIKRAAGMGLDGIVLTEHNRLAPPERLEKLNREHAPFRIFPGIEMRIKGDDFIVIGVYHGDLESRQWDYPDLHGFVRERGGYLALAHPLRYWHGIDANLISYRPDALELYSNNMKDFSSATKQKILQMSNALGLKIIANSDAHAVDNLGYCHILDAVPEDAADVARLLREGRYRLGKAEAS